MRIKLFIPLLILALFISCSRTSWENKILGEAIVKETKTKVLTGINPVSTGFPGGRGTNHLIVYTPDFGANTNTNEWGSEAIVKDGVVVSIGSNNSVIPQNGFVISGNELASQWINKVLEPGMEVVLRGNTLDYTKTENTNIWRARFTFEKARSRIKENEDLQKYADGFKYLEAQCKTTFNQFLKAQNNNNKEATIQLSQKLVTLAQSYYYKTFPPLKDNLKGAWIRLADKTPEALKNTIKSIADAGFNAILPETIYNGYAIYPDAHHLLPQLPQFQGWNPMAVMIEECDKYNMKVIPWCEIFFIGGENSPMVQNKPEWLGEFRHGGPAAKLEPGFHYLCPSRPEVHTFLLEVLDNLASNYKIDGIQLDYIRYSLSEPWESGMCYCDYCKNKVQQQLGFNINRITPENKSEWRKWNNYRENNITSFVKAVNSHFKDRYKDIPLSADVVPNSDISLQKKFQNWKSWVKEELIDDVYIMSYALDNRTIKNDTQLMMKNISGTKVNPIVGLGPYLGFQPELLLEQIEISREMGAAGVCLFSFNALTTYQLKALKEDPFRSN